MSTPWRFAAWMIVSPGIAETCSPFKVNGIALCSSSAMSFMVVSSRDLVREILDHALDRIRRRLVEAADGSIGHRLRQLVQERLIPFRRLQQLNGLRRADAARRALAARLFGEEFHHVERGVARAI